MKFDQVSKVADVHGLKSKSNGGDPIQKIF